MARSINSARRGNRQDSSAKDSLTQFASLANQRVRVAASNASLLCRWIIYSRRVYKLSCLRASTHRLLLAAAFVFVGVVASFFGLEQAAAEDTEDAALQSMFRVGLTDVAIAYSSSRRELVAQSPEEYAKWTMRLMESYAQAALRESGLAQEHLNEYKNVLADFEKRFSDHRRLPWLRWQEARCDFLVGQNALATYLAAPGNEGLRDRALEAVRVVARKLDAIDTDIKKRLPIAARQAASGTTEAPAEQLHQLTVDTALLRCEALLVRAQLYLSGSRDRIAAATQVDATATTVLSRTQEEWGSREKLLVAREAARLELSRANDALLELERLAREASAASTRTRAVSIAIEYLAAQQQASRAMALLPRLQNAGPEYEIALIRIALAEVETLENGNRDEALAKIVATANRVSQQYGDYWKNRANALLVGSISAEELNSGSTTAIDLVIVEVQQLLAADDRSAAIEKLTEHRDIEATAGRGPSAIKLASFAAALHRLEKRFLDAASAIEPVTIQFRDTEGAAQNHLLAITMIQEALRSDQRNSAIRARYEESLAAQLKTWPDSPATTEPTKWAIEWFAGHRRNAELLELLQSKAVRCTTGDAAQRGFFSWLEQLLLTPKQTVRAAAIESMQLAIDSSEGLTKSNTEVSQAARFAVLAGEQFSDWPDADRQRALMSEVMRLRMDSPQWRQAWIASRLLSLARREELSDAIRAANSWDAELLSESMRVAMTAAFVEAFDFTSDASAWAKIVFQDMDAWRDPLLSSKSWVQNALAHRVALWNGDGEALSALEALCEKHKRNGALQLQLAWALAESGDEQLARSTELARFVAAGSKSDPDLNLTANWLRIRNQRAAGQKKEAANASSLLLVTRPMNGVWRQRFESLTAGK